jgi:hypothetical protein
MVLSVSFIFIFKYRVIKHRKIRCLLYMPIVGSAVRHNMKNLN